MSLTLNMCQDFGRILKRPIKTMNTMWENATEWPRRSPCRTRRTTPRIWLSSVMLIFPCWKIRFERLWCKKRGKGTVKGERKHRGDPVIYSEPSSGGNAHDIEIHHHDNRLKSRTHGVTPFTSVIKRKKIFLYVSFVHHKLQWISHILFNHLVEAHGVWCGVCIPIWVQW